MLAQLHITLRYYLTGEKKKQNKKPACYGNVDQIVVHVDSSSVGQEVSLGENEAFQLHPRRPPLLANYRTGLRWMFSPHVDNYWLRSGALQYGAMQSISRRLSFFRRVHHTHPSTHAHSHGTQTPTHTLNKSPDPTTYTPF